MPIAETNTERQREKKAKRDKSRRD